MSQNLNDADSTPIPNEQPLSVHHGDVFNKCIIKIQHCYQEPQADSSLHFKLEELKYHLKERYKNTVIPTVNWLNSGEDLIFKEYYVELQQTDSTNPKNEKPMKLEEMFDEVEGKPATRILIESPPGFGKTTLATKMAVDWANGELYMQRFKLVFFILLRNVKKDTLEGEIHSIIRECRLTEPIDIDEINDGNVLVILDGYDEINDISRTDVTRVLYKVQAQRMTVLVTCRSGLFPLERKELENTLPHRISNMKTAFYDKKVTIKGIADEDRLDFLKKFCPGRCPEEIITTFLSWPNEIVNLLQSPMLLFLVSYFNATGFPVTDKSTITDIYKLLINNIVRTNLTKRGTTIDSDFDLFNLSQRSSKGCQKLLANFGELCLTHLAEGNFKFEINEFMEEIYALGFLTKHKLNQLYESSMYFDCFHLSIMEFFAAYYIWRNYKCRYIWRKFPNINLMCKVLENYKGTSMIYRFLCDLLESEASILIAELKKAKCSLFDDSVLWRMVSSLKESANLVNTIADFVSSPVHSIIDLDLSQFYESEFHANILRAAVKKNVDLCIKISEKVTMNLPDDVIIPVLHLEILDLYDDGMCSSFVTEHSQISCNCLIVDLMAFPLSLGFFDVYGEIILSFFKSVTAHEEKTLLVKHLYPLENIEIPLTLYEILDDVHYWKVQIENRSINVVDSMVYDLLKTNRVYILIYKHEFDIEFTELCHVICSCKSLCEFSFVNLGQKLSFDIHNFIADKRWKHLELVNCDCYCRDEIADPCVACKNAIFDLRVKGKYCNSDDETLDELCPWRNNKPKYILKCNSFD